VSVYTGGVLLSTCVSDTRGAGLELVNSLIEGVDPTKADATPRELLKVGFAGSLRSLVRAISRIAMPVKKPPTGTRVTLRATSSVG